MATNEERLTATQQLIGEMKLIASHPKVVSEMPEIELRLTNRLRKGWPIVAPMTDAECMLGGIALDRIDEFEVPQRSLIQRIKEVFRPQIPEGSTLLKLFPMFPEDAELGKDGAYLQEQAKLAAYGQKSHIIIVNMRSFETLRFVAICCLHELFHAEIAESEQRAFAENVRSEDDRLQEEAMLWTTDAKLLLAIGDENYRYATEKRVEKIKKCWAQKTPPPPWEGAGIAFKKFLGSVSSQEAIMQRDLSFDVYCHFLAAEKHFAHRPDFVNRQKIEILRRYYVEDYDLQKATIQEVQASQLVR